MSARHSFIAKSLIHIGNTIEYMASPDGTTVQALSKRLSITRRSVFRLIRAIEHDLNIPVIINRKTFGGVATYRLPLEFVDKLSHITTPPLILSFRQAVLFYLIFNDEAFSVMGERQGES